MALRRLKHAKAGPGSVVAPRRRPAEVLTDRLPEPVAAAVRQELHGLPYVGGLPLGYMVTRDGGQLEVDDPLVHSRFRYPPDRNMRITDR